MLYGHRYQIIFCWDGNTEGGSVCCWGSIQQDKGVRTAGIEPERNTVQALEDMDKLIIAKVEVACLYTIHHTVVMLQIYTATSVDYISL